MTKRSIIALLAGANVVLFVLLIATTYHQPAAYGQLGGRAGGFVCVAAKSTGQSYDVLYALDTSTRRLHAFHPTARGDKIMHADFRDLTVDFGRQAQGGQSP